MNLGNRLKELRLEKNISQQKLADYLLISRQAISNWETGRTQPDLDTLLKLAEYYHMSIDTLLAQSKENENDAQIKPKSNLSKQEAFYKKITPFIILISSIFGISLLLPKNIHVPFIFFFFLSIIYLLVLMLVYYLVKRLFKKKKSITIKKTSIPSFRNTCLFIFLQHIKQ